MERTERNQEVLASGSYGHLLAQLCVPTVVIMLVMVVYNMADTFFIGQTGDPGKIAAIGLCAPLFSIISGLGTLFGSGGCTVISMALGVGDTRKVKAVTSVCAVGSVLLGGVFTALVLVFLEPICYALGADSATIGFAREYLQIFALGGPFVLFGNVFNNIVRSDGAAVQSMISNALGTVSNIVLDALFILGFGWGVAGAAWVTVIGNLLSCLYLVWYIGRQKMFSLNPADIRLKKEILFPVFTLGLPMCCSTMLMSVSHVLANRLMMGYGAIPMAAQGVAGKVGMVIHMLMMGICMGLQPAISYNYGSKRLSRMYDILRKTSILNISLSAVLGVLCFLGKDALIGAFIDDAQVIAYGRVMVYGSLLTGPFAAMHQLCQSFLQSTGKASYATCVALLDKGIFYLPVLYIMDHFLGPVGIAYSGAVTLLLSLIVSMFFGVRWTRVINRAAGTAAEIE